jgi:hypothetical protein
MAALTYYWVGSTAASINSFSWDVVGNWRTVKLAPGGSGGTAATLVAATRTPFGLDTVNFGRLYRSVSPNTPAPFQIHSPCLFGGITTEGTARAWAGTTAGSSVSDKYYPIFTYINQSYPFSKLGGQLSGSVLNEMTRAFEFHSGQNYFTRGVWVTYGEEGEAGTVWINSQYTGVTGTTSGISFDTQPHYTLRLHGTVSDGARLITTVVATGVTSGATAGVTAAVDGSNNVYTISSNDTYYGYAAFGLNSDSTAANGWSSGTPTEVGQAYKHGATELYGNWNAIRSYVSARDLDLTCVGVKVNALGLEPTYSYVYTTTTSGLPTNGFTTATQFDVQSVYFDKDCSARYIGIKNIDQMHGDVVIHGDVIPTGGFVCVSPQGASAGNSGGIQLANGSFTFTPPSKASTEGTTPTVRVGFPLSAGTKQSTTLTNAYFNQGVQPSVLAVDGNFTATNCYMNEGTIQFSANLPQNATVDISNLQLNGSSVLDMSLPAVYTGNNAIKVITQSDAVTIKPGKGTAMTVSQISTPLTGS